ncbi:hypothetical protein HPB47_020984 [Ixodes persulcatus]|uniref:Uncharacterized protein n=1 Tax=Ixodes persulcatus TaxID=34615 RepID=A0AC60QDY4_IXOPE|nr:hypothetical protein HPB47_020984 [Ixodes persulcatus]
MEETKTGEDSEFTLVQHRQQRTTGVPVFLTPVQEDKQLQQQNPLTLSAEVETLAGEPIRRENATDVAQPTDRVVLTFRPNTERPDKINLGFTRHEVTKYIEAPPRCFNCQALGHIAKIPCARRSRQVVSRCFHRSSRGMLIIFDLDLPNFVAASWSFNQMFLLFEKRMCNQDLIDYPHTSNITVRHRTPRRETGQHHDELRPSFADIPYNLAVINGNRKVIH